jgi:hypothetical protein
MLVNKAAFNEEESSSKPLHPPPRDEARKSL